MGATSYETGLLKWWSLCLPDMMASLIHELCHQAKAVMATLLDEHWIAPGLTRVVLKYAASSFTCYQRGYQKLNISFIDYKSKWPSQDFILACLFGHVFWMARSLAGGKCYWKSHWKKGLSEVVCKYGVLETMENDRRTHFMGEILEEVLRVFKFPSLHTIVEK